MDTNYNKQFFDEYDVVNYSDREYWFNFFDRIAKKIVEYFNPKTVLDAGCAMGYLVEALRDNGVEAYGIDISSYAIDSASEKIKEYLNAQSITDPLPESFPKRFDLVISIEVLEHLFPEDGKKAIAMLCSYSDNFIFTSTPSDIEDKMHVNVQQREYWAKIFAENSFYRDLLQSVSFICPWATLYRKQTNIPEVIFNYELCDRVEKMPKDTRAKHTGCVYFDTGDGFTDSLKSTFTYYDGKLSTGKIHLPQACRAVRIDPIEDLFSVCSSLTIVSNNGALTPSFTNANYSDSGTYYFSNTDPQFNCEFNAHTVWIEIDADINLFNSVSDFSILNNLIVKASESTALTSKNEELSKSISNLVKANEAQAAEICELKSSIEANTSSIAELQATSSKLREENDTLNSKSSELEKENETQATQIDELKNKTSELQTASSQLKEENEALNLKSSELEKENKKLSTSLSASLEKSSKQGKNIAELTAKNYNTALELQNSERLLALCEEKAENLQKEINALESRLALLEPENAAQKEKIDYLTLHYTTAMAQREELKINNKNLTDMYNNISGAFWWKITKPVRVIGDLVKKIFFVKWFLKFRACYKDNGFKYTMRKVKEKLCRKKNSAAARKPLYTEQELEAQKKVKFKNNVKFSILVPLYNTPENFLCEMIDSVIAQTYSNWELCLADGSDSKHSYVGKIVKKYAHSDKRIVYKKLEKNMGISANTNACIDMATGDYISLFDHDDLLHPAALYDVVKVINEENADFIYTDENTFHKTPADAYCPHFKPDYAPDTLRTNNYICHFTSFKSSLINEVGKFRPECDGSQDYDMVLRLTEKAKRIVHIPKILYYWRAHAASVATDISAKPYVITAAHKALEDHLARVGLKGTVENTVVPSMYKINYEIEHEDLISIIIANKDHTDDLDKCLRSIAEKTTYKNYEIIIVENNSEEKKTWDYYEKAKKKYNATVVVWNSPNGEFNYSAINNFGVSKSSGKYIILLNNDTEIISPKWIEEMLMFAQRDDIGAVGAKLYYPDDTIQHAGIGIGILTLAGHYHKNFPKGHPGYMGRLIYAHNVSAVTAACIMLSRKIWDEVGGLDETFKVAFNDVDLCMRIRQAGYLIIFTPFAELYHYESKSRGLDSAPEKRERFVGEVTRFQNRWRKELDAGDPYYNPNFTLESEDFALK